MESTIFAEKTLLSGSKEMVVLHAMRLYRVSKHFYTKFSNAPTIRPLFSIKGGQVHVLPSNMSLAQGALCEPMSCILHGWNRLKAAGSIKANSKVLLLGAGIIGNLWSSLLHHFGVRKVIVSEPSLDRRLIAEGLGIMQVPV